MNRIDVKKITWYVFVWTISLLMVFLFISCEDSIEFSPFVNKQIAKKANSSLLFQTIPYEYTNKIVLTWKKVPNTDSYFVYEFKHKTGTIASKSNPDYVAGPNTLKYTTNISSDFTETRYFVMVARDNTENVLFTSGMIAGKTLGKPIINESQIQKTFYSIEFKWSPVEGVQKYTVQRKKKDDDYKPMHSPMHSEDGSWVFLDENITPEDFYEYRIIAYVMNGEQATTQNDYTFKSPVQVPKQESPSSVNNFVSLKHVYSDRVLLVWKKPDDLEGFDSDALRYSIHRRKKDSHSKNKFSYLADLTSQELKKPKNVDLNVAKVFKNISNPLVYEDTTAETNKVYEYKVIASYDTNEKPGKPSTVVEGAVIPQVSDVVVQGSSDGVVLRWSVPSDFKGTAEVYRSKGGLAFESIKDNITASAYEDKGPHLPTKYTYKVRFVTVLDVIDKDSKTDWNKGVFSAPVDYDHIEITNHDFDFSISRNKIDSLLFTWKIPKDIPVKASDFSIERVVSKGSETFEVINSETPETLDINLDMIAYTGSVTLQVDTNSFKPTLYRLVWRSDGIKKYSKVMLGDVLRIPVSVTATKADHAEYITVRWKPSNGAEKYKVKLRKHDPSGSEWKLYLFEKNDFVSPQNGNRGMQEVRITPPENDRPTLRGTEYDIRIVAIGENEDSDVVESNIVQGSTFGPVGIHVKATKGTSKDRITVSWNAHPYADEYLIVRKTKGTNQEFELAKISSESEKKAYEYNDVVDNPDYLVSNVPSLEKIYFQKYEYSVVPKKRGVRSSMSSVKGEGYLFGSPRGITASNGDYKDKIIVRWPHVGASEYVIYVSDEKDEEYEEKARINIRSQAVGSDIEYEHIFLSEGEKRYYKVRSANAHGEISRMPDETVFACGHTLGTLGAVTGVRASDVDYSNDEGMYIAKHDADTHEYNSKSDISKIDRDSGNSYATKITWDLVSAAKRYHIYRMDFNELTNFWRKIGERKASDERVFFDTKSLILREYRSLYWVVAFVQDKNGGWYADASLTGDPETLPQHKSVAKLSFTKFDASKQTENIQEMNRNANIDVGSRWITPHEYLNWSLGVIGEGVYKLYNTNKTSYGLSRDRWSYIVNFTMEDYSLGAKVLNLSTRDLRRARKNTELVVNSNSALSGTFSESCPKGDGWSDPGCYGTIINNRLGTYVGNGKAINVDSPYGSASVNLSGTARKKWAKSSVKVSNGLHYDFSDGSIEFEWNGVKETFSNENNTGTKGPLNPHVTPIRFNRNYKIFLEAVYGDHRD